MKTDTKTHHHALAITHPQEISPGESQSRSGLAVLDNLPETLFDWCFDLEEPHTRQIALRTNRQNILPVLSMVNSLYGEWSLKGFIVLLIKEGKLEVEDLFYLYQNQPHEAKKQGIFLRLSSIRFILSHAEKFESFGEKRLELLDDDPKGIYRGDIHDAVMDYGYGRHGTGEKVPKKETLSAWYQDTWLLEGKAESLLAILLWENYPEAITLKEVGERAVSLCTRDSSSHGIHRYMALMHSMVKTRSDKVFFADSLVRMAANLIYGSKDFGHGVPLILEFINDALFGKESKIRRCKKIQEKARNEIERMIQEKESAATELSRKMRDATKK
jgi:hypothetical protein